MSFAVDRMPGFGPLSGLHAALSCAATEWVYLMACDMPYFSADWFGYLLSGAGEGGTFATVAQSGRHIEPFHGLYSRELIPSLEAIFALEGGSARQFSFARLIGEAPHILVPEDVVRRFSPDWKLFYSVNSPRDLDALQSCR